MPPLDPLDQPAPLDNRGRYIMGSSSGSGFQLRLLSDECDLSHHEMCHLPWSENCECPCHGEPPAGIREPRRPIPNAPEMGATVDLAG